MGETAGVDQFGPFGVILGVVGGAMVYMQSLLALIGILYTGGNAIDRPAVAVY